MHCRLLGLKNCLPAGWLLFLEECGRPGCSGPSAHAVHRPGPERDAPPLRAGADHAGGPRREPLRRPPRPLRRRAHEGGAIRWPRLLTPMDVGDLRFEADVRGHVILMIVERDTVTPTPHIAPPTAPFASSACSPPSSRRSRASTFSRRLRTVSTPRA